MLELHHMTASLVITKATIQQLMELGIPTLIMILQRLHLWYALWQSGEDGHSDLRRGLLDAKEEKSEENSNANDIKESKLLTFENTVEDYGELMLQYGFVALFGIAYPLTAFVFFINDLLELRSDLFKFLYIRNRAPADLAQNIGKWDDVLRFLNRCAVWTNAGILVFTTDRDVVTLSDVSAKDVAKFFILKHILSAINHLINAKWSGKLFKLFHQILNNTNFLLL